jgi:predicted nucleotidyltransferase
MSILDDKKNTLCPEVWDVKQDPPALLPAVSEAIRKLAAQLVGKTPVVSAFVVGSLTGYRYSDDSDLDVTLIVHIDENGLEELRDRTKTVNGSLAPGTKHPINFYLLNEQVSLERFDSVYDLIGKRWIKPPADFGVDLFTVYDQFKPIAEHLDDAKAEALRSITDIDQLRDAYSNGGDPNILRYKLMRRYKDLDHAVEEMAAEYDEAHEDRLRAFKRYLDLAAIGIQSVPSPNLLPENIRYKMLERYSYLRLLVQLKNILGDAGKVKTPEQRREARAVLEEKEPESTEESEPVEHEYTDKELEEIIKVIAEEPEFQYALGSIDVVAVVKAPEEETTVPVTNYPEAVVCEDKAIPEIVSVCEKGKDVQEQQEKPIDLPSLIKQIASSEEFQEIANV